MNLLLGEIKRKPGEEAEEDRAAPVSNDGDKETADPKGSTETKNGVQGCKEKQFTEIRKVQKAANLLQNQITTKKRKPRKTNERVR